MRRSLAFSVLGVVAATYALLSFAQDSIANDPCTILYSTASQCWTDNRCDWCGRESWSYPQGKCYEKWRTESCCYGSGVPNSEYCNPNAYLCNTSSHQCIHYADFTSIGACRLSICCPLGNPVVCPSTGCHPSGWGCCGPQACPPGTSCCGLGEPNPVNTTACCGAGESQCCASADGVDHWCCPSTATCNLDTQGCS
jgi:hypothetical protein